MGKLMWILGEIAMVSQTIKPLITSVNKPMVTKTNGSDRTVIIGLITALTAEKISPASKNVAIDIGTELSVSYPNSCTETHKPSEQMNQRMINESDFSITLIIAYCLSHRFAVSLGSRN